MRRRRRCCTWTLALLLALLFAGCGRVETVPEDREAPLWRQSRRRQRNRCRRHRRPPMP